MTLAKSNIMICSSLPKPAPSSRDPKFEALEEELSSEEGNFEGDGEGVETPRMGVEVMPPSARPMMMVISRALVFINLFWCQACTLRLFGFYEVALARPPFCYVFCFRMTLEHCPFFIFRVEAPEPYILMKVCLFLSSSFIYITTSYGLCSSRMSPTPSR